MFIPALPREKGILAKGSQELWPHSQGQPRQGMGRGMHQAIFAEEDILKSSIQLPLLQCHAQQVDFWLFTYAPPHSSTAVTNVAERNILQEHNSVFHSAVPRQVSWN